MLKDALYQILNLNHSTGSIEAMLEIDKGNEIFKGHFPGQPVVPGACLLQILKEVLENALSQNLRLKKADQLKFLSLIDPQIDSSVQLKIYYSAKEDDKLFNITANMVVTNRISFKFKGSFIVV